MLKVHCLHKWQIWSKLYFSYKYIGVKSIWSEFYSKFLTVYSTITGGTTFGDNTSCDTQGIAEISLDNQPTFSETQLKSTGNIATQACCVAILCILQPVQKARALQR